MLTAAEKRKHCRDRQALCPDAGGRDDTRVSLSGRHAVADFQNHPAVINGFSDLMVEVFGDSGKGARSAVGMGSLPTNIAVEVEAIIEVRN